MSLYGNTSNAFSKHLEISGILPGEYCVDGNRINYWRNAMNQLSALELLRGECFWSAFEKPQREALAMSFLDLNNNGIFPLELFGGLWLFPLGLLVIHSGFLPCFLGLGLIINGVTYVTISFTGMLSPQHVEIINKIGFSALPKGYLIIKSTFLARFLGVLSILAGLGLLTFLSPTLGYRLFPYIAALGLFGAAAMILWLLVKGVNTASAPADRRSMHPCFNRSLR